MGIRCGVQRSMGRFGWCPPCRRSSASKTGDGTQREAPTALSGSPRKPPASPEVTDSAADAKTFAAVDRHTARMPWLTAACAPGILAAAKSAFQIQNRVDSGMRRAKLGWRGHAGRRSQAFSAKRLHAGRMERIDLRSMSRRQLVNLARKAGIPPQFRLTKAQLIAGLEAVSSSRAEPLRPAELPQNYGRTRLTLLEVEPCWVYAYWEVTTADCAAAVDLLGAEAQWILRFYDLTDVRPESAEAGYFDLFVDLEAGNWYVNLWDGGKSYFAEVGLLSGAGQFVPVCRSNMIRVPPSGLVPESEPRWLAVDGVPERSDDSPSEAEDVPAPEPASIASQPQSDPAAELPVPAAAPVPAHGAELGAPPSSVHPEPAPPEPPLAGSILPSSHNAGSFGLGRSLLRGGPPIRPGRHSSRPKMPPE